MWAIWTSCEQKAHRESGQQIQDRTCRIAYQESPFFCHWSLTRLTSPVLIPRPPSASRDWYSGVDGPRPGPARKQHYGVQRRREYFMLDITLISNFDCPNSSLPKSLTAQWSWIRVGIPDLERSPPFLLKFHGRPAHMVFALVCSTQIPIPAGPLMSSFTLLEQPWYHIQAWPRESGRCWSLRDHRHRGKPLPEQLKSAKLCNASEIILFEQSDHQYMKHWIYWTKLTSF